MICKKLSESHSDILPQSELNPTPVSRQPLPKKVAFVDLPSSPSSKVKLVGERIKPHRPSRPPSLLIPLGLVPQGYSFETSALVNPPASPSSWVTGERIRKPSLPTRPPPLVLHPERVVRRTPMIDSNTVEKSAGTIKLHRPPQLLIPPGRANRDVLQGDSSETAALVKHPASRSSRATGERIRKPSLPTRPGPPPLVLHIESAVRRASKVDSNTVAAKSRTITFVDRGNRDSLGSLLPNPWDSDAQPQHATFKAPIFQRPVFFTASSRANALQAGLPRNPRETVMPPEVRSLEVTQNIGPGSIPRQRPARVCRFDGR